MLMLMAISCLRTTELSCRLDLTSGDERSPPVAPTAADTSIGSSNGPVSIPPTPAKGAVVLAVLRNGGVRRKRGIVLLQLMLWLCRMVCDEGMRRISYREPGEEKGYNRITSCPLPVPMNIEHFLSTYARQGEEERWEYDICRCYLKCHTVPTPLFPVNSPF